MAMLTQSGGGDRELILRTLDLEQRLVGLYARGEAPHSKLFGEHCREHVEGLETALRNRGGQQPGEETAPRSGDAGARAALTLETDAVAACYRAIGALRDGRLIPAFAAIMACHGQHLVVLRESLHRDPLPAALETGGVR
jgi:hypothetical protein